MGKYRSKPEIQSPARRDFLKASLLGVAGFSSALSGCSSYVFNRNMPGKTSIIDPGKAIVSLVPGNDRREMIYNALQPFRDNLAEAIRNKQVVVKLNCVGQNGHPLMVTHPDAVRGVLDFLQPIYKKTVIVGESTVQNKNPEKTFEIFGYLPLEREYNAKIVELNHEPTTYQWILDKNLKPIPIKVIDTFLDPNNFIISVTRLKTHNCVVATLSLKNVVMGSPQKIPNLNINDKAKMHAGNKTPKFINHNLFLMANRVRPDFAVLDGFEGVEGNGPANGTPVDHRVALAGPDFLAVDRIGTELMGIPWEDIGYLNYCSDAGLGQGDRSKIDIIGPAPGMYVRKYKLHENIEWQLTWKEELDVGSSVKRN
ncbi:MAG: DUF362 domain-containing protein [Candidatus Latescibacteria bacterium]|nr:DUF362 domain-containing protein [Candidatus Latescibacterota bacterium]